MGTGTLWKPYGAVDTQDSGQTEDKPCPYIRANVLSRLTVWWLTPLIQLGYRAKLSSSDMYDVLPDERSENVTEELRRAWNNSNHKEPKGTLLGTQLRLYRAPLIISGILRVLLEAMKLVQPVLVGYILTYLQGTGTISMAEAYVCAAAMVAISVFFSLPYTWCINISWGVGMRGRAALTGLVYNKAGRYINYIWLCPLTLLTVIILLFAEFGTAFGAGCGALIVLLILEIGLGTLVGKTRMKVSKWTDKRNSVMSEIMGGIQMIKSFCWEGSFSHLVESHRSQELRALFKGRLVEAQLNTIYFLANKIVAFVTILSAVMMGDDVTPAQAVKLIGWLEFARTMMFGLFPLGVIHTAELHWSMVRIQKFLELPDQTAGSTGKTTMDMLNMNHKEKSQGQQLGAAGGYTKISPDLFHEPTLTDEIDNESINHSNSTVPSDEERLVTSDHARYSVGTNEDVVKTDTESKLDVKQYEMTRLGVVDSSDSEAYSVILTDILVGRSSGMARDDDEGPDMRETVEPRTSDSTAVSLSISKGELIVVVGGVGAGKTSLLMAILGELQTLQGNVTTNGSMSYVPQEPWIISDTLKQNVLLGQEQTPRYDDVMELCALTEDLQSMPHGEQTLVGERGWRLSGGQKTRVNLARTVYIDADIYLLDDPLSAVDVKVGRFLFDRCINGLLKGKTRILVTHQLQYLSEADRIIVMNKGRIVEYGTFEEIETTSAYQNITFTHDPSRVSRKKDLTTHIQEFSTETGLEESADFPSRARGHAQLVTSPDEKVRSSRRCSLSVDTSQLNNTSQGKLDFLVENKETFLYAWGILLLILLVGSDLQALVVYIFSILASRKLHLTAFKRVMKAPMSFFESNPIGRILNRFSRDVGFVDMVLPRTYFILVGGFALMVAQVLFILVVDPWLALATVPIVGLMAALRHYSLAALRDLRRIEATCRSPTYSLIMDSIRGLPVLRALGRQDYFMEQFHRFQDKHTAAWFLFFNAYRWLGVRTELLLAVFMAACLIVAIATKSLDIAESGSVGLGLTYLTFILGNLQMLLILSADINTMMTSVERLCQYGRLPQQEAPDHTDVTPPSDWPSQGRIRFCGVSLRYETGACALRDLNFEVNPREKIGIVGRTGAGKSTLIKCILRLVEPQGLIIIDGVDITELGLTDLRENISVIPQDPIFIAGTLRKNLDPFGQYADDDIWTALERVHMKTVIAGIEGGLWCEVLESGTNFSVGEKQLLCLARALLRTSVVLLVDEATANVDRRTDALVQATIRQAFQGSTVLTIAHRLETVMDSDRVLVLHEGRIVEFDSPEVLLQDASSRFHQLVTQVMDIQKLGTHDV